MTWLLTCDAHRKAIAEIEQTKSDRATVIVATSVIEKDLVRAIEIRMVPDERETSMLFKHSGPLGAFEAKVHLAYLMAMIDGPLRDDLTRIADIRNRFAHQVEPLRFNSHAIHNLCDELAIVDAPSYPEIPDPGLPAERRSPTHLAVEATPRDRFIQATKLFLIAFWRINHAESPEPGGTAPGRRPPEACPIASSPVRRRQLTAPSVPDALRLSTWISSHRQNGDFGKR